MKEVEKPNLILTEVRVYGEIKQSPIQNQKLFFITINLFLLHLPIFFVSKVLTFFNLTATLHR